MTVIQAIKVNAAVSGTTSADAGAAYTGPATGYAIINLTLTRNTGTNAVNALVAGRIVNAVASTTAGAFIVATVYVGPSQAVTLSLGATTTATLTVSGVEFVNS